MPRFRVKLTWSIPVEAASQEEALAQVEKLLREHPSTFITGVEDFYAPKGGLIKRFVTGK